MQMIMVDCRLELQYLATTSCGQLIYHLQS
nr:MAG TPA: hypothetical protein [Bacteriophage sp.]